MVKRVFILGAGASRDLQFNINHIDGGYCTYKTNEYDSCLDGPKGPLSSGYFYDINRFVETIKKELKMCQQISLGASLVKYIESKYDTNINNALNNEAVSKKINIEDLYSCLEEECDKAEDPEIPYEAVVHLFTARLGLLDYLVSSLNYVCYYCFSKHHDTFAKYITKTDANIISFNWDILLDEAMYYSGKWDYGDGYGMEFESVSNKNDAKMNNIRSRNLILKPHGSINWYCEADKDEEKYVLNMLCPRKLRAGTFGLPNRYISDENKSLTTCIVSPGRKRMKFNMLWKKIYDVMRTADEIYIVGFSLNNFDSHIKQEFEKIAIRSTTKIFIVNPDGEKVKSEIALIYPNNEAEILCSTFAEFCQKLPKI